jgi:hypothetical protein
VQYRERSTSLTTAFFRKEKEDGIISRQNTPPQTEQNNSAYDGKALQERESQKRPFWRTFWQGDSRFIHINPICVYDYTVSIRFCPVKRVPEKSKIRAHFVVFLRQAGDASLVCRREWARIMLAIHICLCE